MVPFLVYALRALILVLAIWFVGVMLGKKSLLQMTAFDLGILMIISNVISQPLVNKDVFKTAFGVIVLALFAVLIAHMTLRRKFYRMDYAPVILVASGVIKKEALKKCRMSAFTLMSMLRAQGFMKLQDVNFAVFEAGGNLSVFPKNSARPVTVEDMALKQPEEGMTMPVIVDGQIFREMLDYAKVDEAWLRDQLHSLYRARPEDVFFAEIDDQKALYVNLMQESAGEAPPPASKN
jgi:uncharacterized membrane protein YcaP (DUF421 family)